MLTWEQFLEAKFSEKQKKAAHKKPGGSSVGEKRKTSSAGEGPFCGTQKGSFPVSNRGQWRAAKSYARHDPSPGKVKACADRVARSRGWKKD